MQFWDEKWITLTVEVAIVRGFVICGVQVEGVGVEGQSGKLRRDRGEQVVREAGARGWCGV